MRGNQSSLPLSLRRAREPISLCVHVMLSARNQSRAPNYPYAVTLTSESALLAYIEVSFPALSLYRDISITPSLDFDLDRNRHTRTHARRNNITGALAGPMSLASVPPTTLKNSSWHLLPSFLGRWFRPDESVFNRDANALRLRLRTLLFARFQAAQVQRFVSDLMLMQQQQQQQQAPQPSHISSSSPLAAAAAGAAAAADLPRWELFYAELLSSTARPTASGLTASGLEHHLLQWELFFTALPEKPVAAASGDLSTDDAALLLRLLRLLVLAAVLVALIELTFSTLLPIAMLVTRNCTHGAVLRTRPRGTCGRPYVVWRTSIELGVCIPHLVLTRSLAHSLAHSQTPQYWLRYWLGSELHPRARLWACIRVRAPLSLLMLLMACCNNTPRLVRAHRHSSVSSKTSSLSSVLRSESMAC